MPPHGRETRGDPVLDLHAVHPGPLPPPFAWSSCRRAPRLADESTPSQEPEKGSFSVHLLQRRGNASAASVRISLPSSNPPRRGHYRQGLRTKQREPGRKGWTRSPSTPLLARLARGEVARKTSEDLQLILRLLPVDPALADPLDMGATIEQLLVTEAELIIRFKQYEAFPFRLALCCKTWNPTGFLVEVESFLEQPWESLDVGIQPATA